jgi:hypothetical protein
MLHKDLVSKAFCSDKDMMTIPLRTWDDMGAASPVDNLSVEREG